MRTLVEFVMGGLWSVFGQNPLWILLGGIVLIAFAVLIYGEFKSGRKERTGPPEP